MQHLPYAISECTITHPSSFLPSFIIKAEIDSKSLISNGSLSGNFSTPKLALASIFTGGVISLLATEGISGMARDFFRRDPAVEDAYKRLMSGVDPTLGRSFQSLMPEEREKASELVGMFAKMHQGDTPMLQTEIRTLISVLNATEPRDYSSELDNQIKMVRNQILNEQELEIKPVTPKQSRSQMDMS